MQAFLLGLYLQGGIAAMATHAPPPTGEARYFDINVVENPYAFMEAGYSVERGRWQFDLAARYMASVAVGPEYEGHRQYGEATFELRARWYPFRD